MVFIIISTTTPLKQYYIIINIKNSPLHQRWHWHRYPNDVSLDLSSSWQIPWPLQGFGISAHGWSLWWHRLPPNLVSGQIQMNPFEVSLHSPPFSQGCASHCVCAQNGPWKNKKWLFSIVWNRRLLYVNHFVILVIE